MKLRTITDYSVRNADWDDPRSRGYYNPPTLLEYNGNDCVIGAGQSDYVDLFYSPNDDKLLLLSTNPSMGYAGLSWLETDLSSGEHSVVFVQNEHTSPELEGLYPDFHSMGLDRRFFDYSAISQAKFLADHPAANWG